MNRVANRVAKRITKRVAMSLISLSMAIAGLAVAHPSLLAQGEGAIAQHSRPHSHPPGAEHEHGTLEIAAGQPIPTVNLRVHPDSRRGWNLEVQVTNFRFTPEAVNRPGSTTEGHAHLYVNGRKLTRLYSNWYYLESLPPGRHEIKVSLNTNTHETLTRNGQPIQAIATITVPAR